MPGQRGSKPKLLTAYALLVPKQRVCCDADDFDIGKMWQLKEKSTCALSIIEKKWPKRK